MSDENARWVLERSFDTKKDLDAFIKAEKCWSVRSTVTLASGLKTLYRCNLVLSKGTACEAEAYTLRCMVDDDDDDENEDHLGALQPKYQYDFYRKTADHTHNDGETMAASNKVTDDIRDKIIAMYNDGLRPTTIRFRLRADETIEEKYQPSKRQITNVINLNKIEQCGQNPITMNDLVAFVENNEYDANKDQDTSFVVKFERSASTDPHRMFRYFVSTARLLRMASEAKVLHSDATFKTTTEKLPNIAVGTSDANGDFHLIGLQVSSHETSEAYECAFNAVKEGTMMVTGKEIEPKYLVCDADPAIHKGFKAVFGDVPEIIMCYSHVISNVQRKYKFKDEKNRNDFLNDVRSLHLCSDKSKFDEGFALMKTKWATVEKDVINRFEKSFIRKNFNWFLGAGVRVPKTNNLLERFNGTLKQFQTLYQKKPLKQFLKISLRIVAERSQEYRLDKNEFSLKYTISEDQIRNGCEFNVSFISSTEENEKSEIECFAYSKNPQQPITMDDVREWLNSEHNTFDQSAQNHYKMWKTTFSSDQRWQEAKCTCQAFDDDYMCNQIISIVYQLEVIEKPALNYDGKPLFQVKSGHPANVPKKPLQID